MDTIKNCCTGQAQHKKIAAEVYGSLLGQILPEYRQPWVEDIFVPGHPCYEAYIRMWEAYTRLRERLGVVNEDPDAEEIIDALLTYGRIISFEMFRYGMRWQEMQEK